MKIALISCSKEKKNYACAAHELYSSSKLFSASYRYAKQVADKVYLLSALYGLVSEDVILEPYDKTLKDMSRNEQIIWANTVLADMQAEFNIDCDEFIILAGSFYYRDLISSLPHYTLPLGQLRMGERISWLNRQNSKLSKNIISHRDSSATYVEPAFYCSELHKIFNEMPRYTWDQISEIPFDSGIYIVFETGEKYHGMDRVVRVGTHRSPGRLSQRLTDHFVRENHDGSIFRKNIGKAILNAYHDPYLHNWTVDTSKPENISHMDKKKNADTETRVSKYLRNTFSFVVFPVEDQRERLRLEEAIISTLNHTNDFGPSERWADRFSPEIEIRTSGMWLKQGLDSQPLTEAEFAQLKRYCSKTPNVPSDKVQKSVQPSKRTQSCVKSTHRYGKYENLYHFLCNNEQSTVKLSFDEMEKILGFELPRSATIYTAWWNGHNHCYAWKEAGYEVRDIQNGILTKSATFVKR